MMVGMYRFVKKLGRRSINTSLRLSKGVLDRSPKLKSVLREQIQANMWVGPQSAVDEYKLWVEKNTLDAIQLYRQVEEAKKLKYRPLISIIVPTYNTPEKFFREMVESVLSQTYENWELILIDDASPEEKTRELIMEYALKDKRIVHKFLEQNHHIAGATNEGIKIATGEFISLFDHDDILWPNALFEVVKALNKKKSLNLIYTDEDKIDGDNRFAHKDPFFKPDWNPDLLRSVNYITHFTTIRKSVLDEFGYESSDYNGAQDWELFLRITRNIKDSAIHHIPTVLYSWRVHEDSTAKSIGTKPYVIESQKRALEDDMVARGIVGAEIVQNKETGAWQVVYPIAGEPLVSIVIPTKNLYEMLKKCIDSIYTKSSYKNIEVILVDTGSSDQRVIDWYVRAQKKYNGLKVVSFVEDKFSYAKSCNFGAKHATGELLIMLNNDIEVTQADWIEQMIGYSQQTDIGIVGVRLYYPGRNIIQHAGVGVGIGGIASNLFQLARRDRVLTLNQNIMLNYTRNISAITAACIMLRTELFNEVGGFAEKYRINYNDVDLCLRVLDAGYRNVYLPHVSLIHHESISRGLPNTKGHDGAEFKEAQETFKNEWKKYIQHDPALNPNFRKDTVTFDIKV